MRIFTLKYGAYKNWFICVNITVSRMLMLIGHMLNWLSIVINLYQLLEEWIMIEMRGNVPLLIADVEIPSTANVSILSSPGIEQRSSAPQ